MPDRLTIPDALELYQHATIHELGRLAHATCLQKHPEPVRTYVIDRNINYSNICVARCAFCNFKTPPGGEGGYVLATDVLLQKIQELGDIGGTQVLMQGGLHPDLPLAWYEDLLRTIKAHFPRIHLHAFSPPEIVHLARLTGLGRRDVLARLQAAGLDSMPGGGAEILVDRVRKQISPGKCGADDWLDAMRQAHGLGMRTSATMMFGHVETDAERIEHLDRLRQLQDETGGFIAFICWTFQHERTPLFESQRVSSEGGQDFGFRISDFGLEDENHPRQGDPSAQSSNPQSTIRNPQSSHLRLAGAVDYLRMLSIARLFLDNVANLQASWVTQGEKIGQLALFYGANDMGGVMMEENVVSAAGTTYRLGEARIRHLIRAAGWTPHQRNQRYDLIEETGAAAVAEQAT